MAVEETPLGYRVPDGDDPVRNGDNTEALRTQLRQPARLES